MKWQNFFCRLQFEFQKKKYYSLHFQKNRGHWMVYLWWIRAGQCLHHYPNPWERGLPRDQRPDLQQVLYCCILIVHHQVSCPFLKEQSLPEKQTIPEYKGGISLLKFY